jgi:hypothetical protein
MSAQPKHLYGEDNTVAFRDALKLAKKNRNDVITDDVSDALGRLLKNTDLIKAIADDYPNQDHTEIGRIVSIQIDLLRAEQLQQAMP